MRLLTVIALVSCLAFALRAEEPAPRQPAPKPEVGVRAAGLPVPSSFKFNSSTGAAKPYMAAPVGQALTADGAGKSSWAFIKGEQIDSGAASTGMVLTANGTGGSIWGTPSGIPAALLPISIANGGTGSSTQNFVDLATDQSIGGNKGFNGTLSVGRTFVVEPRPNSTGPTNLFIGRGAGASNTVGDYNVASGFNALFSNTSGFLNIASGHAALYANTTGSNNVASGDSALNHNTTGNSNVASGFSALGQNTAGSNNIAIGKSAGVNLLLDNNIAIGNDGVAADIGIIRIGTSGTHTDTYLSGMIHGDGSGLTNLTAANITGTLPVLNGSALTNLSAANITGTLPALNGSALTNLNAANITGTLPALNGSALTNLNAGNIASGTLADARLSTNIPTLTNSNAFSGAKNTFSGNVGIGTTTPTQATLVVNGSVNTAYISPLGFLQTTGATGNNGNVVLGTSIYANNDVAAAAFIAYSDERIKNVIGVSNGAADLNTLMSIRITNYTYKDTIAKGNRPQKKVIAQQVEKVFPQAVRQSTDVVPDIYQKATTQDGWVRLSTNLAKGDRVKLIGEKEEGIYDVLEIKDGAFRTAFMPATEKVFVFGREVKDFRAVDYEAIAMLNVSATQEIKKEKDAEIKALRDENAAMKKRLAEHDARLARIEKLLEDGQPKTVRALAEKE